MESSSTVEQYSEFLDQAQRHQIIFYYVGYFSQTIIASMAEAMKLQLQVADVSGPTRRKLFSLFVEMTQNIIHYSSDALTPASQNNGELRHGSVCIKKEGDGRFLLLCANPIKNDVADRLRPKLDALRNMTVEEIKQAYKETLLAETPEDSKGAGVGFLTMARDAREPLEFLFQPLDGTEDMTMFYLKAVI